MKLSIGGKQDLVWWKNNIENFLNWVHPPVITDTVYTDVSDTAWGLSLIHI